MQAKIKVKSEKYVTWLHAINKREIFSALLCIVVGAAEDTYYLVRMTTAGLTYQKVNESDYTIVHEIEPPEFTIGQA